MSRIKTQVYIKNVASKAQQEREATLVPMITRMKRSQSIDLRGNHYRKTIGRKYTIRVPIDKTKRFRDD